MLAGGVEVLASLFADDMTSIDHLGRRADKSHELEAYRTGVLKLDQIDVSYRDDHIAREYNSLVENMIEQLRKDEWFSRPFFKIGHSLSCTK